MWFLIWLVYVPEWPSDDTLIASRERSLFESCAIYAKQRAHERRRERTESVREGPTAAMSPSTSSKSSHWPDRLLGSELKARLRIMSARLRAVPALAMVCSAPLWAIFVAMFCRVWMWYILHFKMLFSYYFIVYILYSIRANTHSLYMHLYI